MTYIENARARALEALGRIAWLAPLLGRLAVGLVFVSTGWGKVHHIPKVTHFFETLGIPAPAFNAVLVAWTELACGSLLVVGFLTRFATVPLLVSMTVAIWTAKRGDVHGLFDFVGLDEVTYVVVLLMIAILGPGSVSLDRVLVRVLGWNPRSRAR